MKTSNQQFEILVTFMEENGDLSKPSKDPKGRIGRIQQWEQLAALLNSDGGGDTKSTEKWKKVWSDYKNNTKKKAARLHRAASGTGGGPATHTKLTDLEERVLQIMGRQVATGLAVDELGPTPTNIQEQNTPETATSASLSDIIVLEGQWNQPGPSSRIHIPPPSPQDLILQENVINMEDCETHCVTEPEPVALASPHRNIRESPPRIITPRRRPRGSPRRLARTSPRRPMRRTPPRRSRPSQSMEAAEYFLQSDREWREFRIRQHNELMEVKREQNRINNLVVETQRQWLNVAGRALDILDRIVDKYNI